MKQKAANACHLRKLMDVEPPNSVVLKVHRTFARISEEEGAFGLCSPFRLVNAWQAGLCKAIIFTSPWSKDCGGRILSQNGTLIGLRFFYGPILYQEQLKNHKRITRPLSGSHGFLSRGCRHLPPDRARQCSAQRSLSPVQKPNGQKDACSRSIATRPPKKCQAPENPNVR